MRERARRPAEPDACCASSEEEAEEHAAWIAAAEAALVVLDELAAEDWAREETVEQLCGLYSYRRRRLGSLRDELQDED